MDSMKRVSGKYNVRKCAILVLLVILQSTLCFSDNRDANVFFALQKPAQEIEYNRETIIYQMLTDGEWKDKNKTVNSYDEQGIWTESFSQSFENGAWTNRTKGYLTYNDQGNIIEALSQTWENGEWIDYYKQTSSYDEQGNMIVQLGQLSENGVWNNESKWSNTYDRDGNKTEVIIELWSGGKWETVQQEANTYDDEGKMTEYLRGSHNDGKINISKYIFTYDDQGLKTEELRMRYRDEEDDFVTGSKMTYTYNDRGDMTEEHHQYLRDTEWVTSTDITVTYDDQGRIAESITQAYLRNMNITVRYLYSYDYITHIAENTSDTPAALPLTANYPNPFNLSTTIRFLLPVAGYAELVIFNVMGQKVRNLLSGEMTPGEHFAVWDGCDDSGDAVTTGVYFSRLTTLNSSVSGRMMLVK
jgi:hypothetical protein